jgi:hypothetical protein
MHEFSKLPDFLIIGAAKAGTTALYRALSRHPRIFCCPEKEPRFFAYAGATPRFPCTGGAAYAAKIVVNEAAYCRLFADSTPGMVAGEASTIYLSSDSAPEAAFRYAPQARLVVILRHPVARAYSHWLQMRHEGFEPLADFEAAWEAEEGRMALGYRPSWQYRTRGFYGRYLERWLQYFPREQLLVLFYEDWKQRPVETLGRVFNHLGVGPLTSPHITMENRTSRQPRWPWLHHRMVDNNALRHWAQQRLPLSVRDAITRIVTSINLKAGPELLPDLRARLAVIFHEDIHRIEKLTQRDLSEWMS